MVFYIPFNNYCFTVLYILHSMLALSNDKTVLNTRDLKNISQTTEVACLDTNNIAVNAFYIKFIADIEFQPLILFFEYILIQQ